MKAVVAAFNQEKTLPSRGLLRDFEPSDHLRMQLFEALGLVRAGGPLVGGGMTWPPPTSCAAVAGKKRSFPQKVCATFVSIIRDHAFATRSDGYNR